MELDALKTEDCAESLLIKLDAVKMYIFIAMTMIITSDMRNLKC